jgi:transcriptional regulator with XRE-family HTH domain
MARKREAPGLVEQLRSAIRDSGQNLSQLARASGVGPDRLSRFMRGERDLTFGAAEKVARVLGLVLAPGRPAAAPRRKARKRRGTEPGTN